MVGCSAPNCHNSTAKGVRLFVFPTEKNRRQQWTINCRRDKWIPTSGSRLCEVHFEPSQFENNRQDGWKKLRPNAVPTIFDVPNPPRLFESRRRILKRCASDDGNDFQKIHRISMEHKYAKAAAGSPSIIYNEANVSHSPSPINDNIIIKEMEPSVREGVLCLFNDFDVAEHVEVVTSQPSPRKLVQVENRVKILTKKNKQLARQIRLLKKQLKASRQENEQLQKKLKNIFSGDQIRVLQSSTGLNRGRKWSAQTVQRSLQMLFACGASGYGFLRSQGYPLPAPRTLRHSLEGVRFDSGLLTEVFELLQLKVDQMNDKERDCALTLDEMSITPSVEYDVRTGRLMGEVTLPGHSGKATHAMVFMLSGISTRWKQTVAYYFTGNSVFGSAVKPIVTNIIQRAWDIGLRVVTVTSDMGACNRAIWSAFGICCGRSSRTVNAILHPCSTERKLYFLADAPHLIKNLKAALVNGQDIVLPNWVLQEHNLSSNRVTAKHLHSLLTFQENLHLKISPKLTAKTLTPGHFDKMKVSNAMSFFSHSNAAGLEYLVQAHSHSNDLLTTAWFLKTINHWFDLVSSRRLVTALSWKDPASYTQATDFLRRVIALFESLSIGEKGMWKPVQTGIILTTTSILDISEQLLSSGYQFVLTARFTSDCIENLFSCIRTNNPIPSPLEFKNKLRLISVAQFLRVKATSSYEVDDAEYLVQFLSSKSSANLEIDEHCDKLCFSSVSSLSNADLASLYYLTGYLVSRVVKNNKTCETCARAIQSDSNSAGSHCLLQQLKSYKEGCLVSCTSEVFELLQEAEKIFRATNFSLLHHKKNVRKLLLSEIQQACADVTFPNCHDVKNVLLRRFITLRLRIWAKDQRTRLTSHSRTADNGALGSKSMAMRMAVIKFR